MYVEEFRRVARVRGEVLEIQEFEGIERSFAQIYEEDVFQALLKESSEVKEVRSA